MKVLILGGTGMLGHLLVRKLKDEFELSVTIKSKCQTFLNEKLFGNVEVFENFDAERCDLDFDLLNKIQPEAIINCIGIVKQKSESNDLVKTLTVNSIFPHKVAQAAEKLNIRFITVSTDCVFSGKTGNYTEEDIPDAFDLYGKSKQLGEVTTGNSLTLRTSIIGRELTSKNGLVEWFLSQSGGNVKGYKNAVFSGFPTIILSEIISDILKKQQNLKGLYHLSSNPIDKYNLLLKIKEHFKPDISVEPFEDFVIDRSLDSSKFRKETGFSPLSWDEMLEIMVEDNNWYEDLETTTV